MDAILSSLGGSLPQLGVGGLLVFVLGLLVKLLVDEKSRHDVTRQGHQAELDKQAERLEKQHAKDRDQDREDELELRRELAAARARYEDLQAAVDLEREQRRAAEDAAANARRGPAA